MEFLLTTRIIVVISLFSLQDSLASSPCTNCSHELCVSNTTSHCLYGCKAGYWGGRCRHLCKDRGCEPKSNCYRNPVRINNEDIFVCPICPDGYYRGGTCQTFNCTEKCPVNCISCTAPFECHKCLPGYYNQGNLRNCSNKCPENCVSCLSPFLCTECKPPYYNVGTINNCSWTCPKTCKECEGETCLECVEGFYNTSDYCEKQCSEGCTGKKCDNETGACTCRKNYSGDKCCARSLNCYACSTSLSCSVCNTGYFGQSCEYNCSSTCTDGCVLSSGECTACAKNTYGRFCESKCSPGCVVTSVDESPCDSSSGICYKGCELGYFTDHCDEKCRQTCPLDCDVQTGHCLTCAENTLGLYCNQSCPENCKDNSNNTTTCNKTSGLCLNGCKPGYFGEMCTEVCNKQCAKLVCDRLSGDCLLGQADDKDSERLKDIAITAGCTFVLTNLLLSAAAVLRSYVRKRNSRKSCIVMDKDSHEDELEVTDSGNTMYETLKAELTEHKYTRPATVYENTAT